MFITHLTIENVRHLKNIDIPLSENEMKHLIFTGKNGSGKTSVLDALAGFLDCITADYYWRLLNRSGQKMEVYDYTGKKITDEERRKQSLLVHQKSMEYMEEEAKRGLNLKFNSSLDDMNSCFKRGNLIFAYYKAERVFEAEIPKHVEKVDLKANYSISESPRKDFVKYLLDMKMTEALALAAGKKEKAEKIRIWFEKFQDLLKKVFGDETLQLQFDEDTFAFCIHEEGKEPFDFNTMSGGFSAVLDIIVDLIVRMERQSDRTFQFDMPGIVLIDEIETHLHLELQKHILSLLTTVFPNVQFIVSTHSPFVLNSLDNVVIYDLENHLLVENGLTNVPYDGIVEGYFGADSMSDLLKQKFSRYKYLVKKEKLEDNDFDEIAKLEVFLDEIPDYLAMGISTEYQRLKLEFEQREDL